MNTQETLDAPDVSPLVKLASKILQDAIRRGAEMIRLQVVENGAEIKCVVFDKQGSKPFVPQEEIPRRLAHAIISRFKIMGNLSISEHNRPQTGECEIESGSITYKLRVTSIPSLAVVQLLGNGPQSMEEVIIEFNPA